MHYSCEMKNSNLAGHVLLSLPAYDQPDLSVLWISITVEFLVIKIRPEIKEPGYKYEDNFKYTQIYQIIF